MAYREFKVEFGKSGEILVDGVAYPLTVRDQLTHQLNSAEVLRDEVIWDRPDNADSAWKSPCKFCTYKEVCNKYDQGKIKSKEEVIGAIEEEIKKLDEDKASK